MCAYLRDYNGIDFNAASLLSPHSTFYKRPVSMADNKKPKLPISSLLNCLEADATDQNSIYNISNSNSGNSSNNKNNTSYNNGMQAKNELNRPLPRSNCGNHENNTGMLDDVITAEADENSTSRSFADLHKDNIAPALKLSNNLKMYDDQQRFTAYRNYQQPIDNLIDTDSEYEYEAEFYATKRCELAAAKDIPKMGFWLYLISVCLPSKQEAFSNLMLRYSEYRIIKCLLLLLQHLNRILFIVLSLCCSFIMRFQLRDIKIRVREMVRQLLWYMAKSKGTDISTFALVICATPWLFAIGIIGFVLALVCQLKYIILHFWRMLRIQFIY